MKLIDDKDIGLDFEPVVIAIGDEKDMEGLQNSGEIKFEEAMARAEILGGINDYEDDEPIQLKEEEEEEENDLE